jgi:DNA-binding CsgD family transcriptional regulator
MVNHIYILFMIFSFCTGMILLVPCLMIFLQKGRTFKYYNNYRYFFHAYIAFTVFIFSNSLNYYINLNIHGAGIYANMLLVVIEIISIHMFFLFFPLFIRNFFSVKLSKVLNITYILVPALSLIIFLIVFYRFYLPDTTINVNESITSFPIASICNGIFAVIILYTVLISILYFKKLNNGILQQIIISNLILILIFFFGAFIVLLFQFAKDLISSINIKIYLLPGFYILWNILSGYYCLKYYLFETSSFSAQGFSLERFVQTYDLTGREVEIVQLLIRGCGNAEICDELSITLPTVKSHISNIFKKAGCSRRTELLSIVIHGI